MTSRISPLLSLDEQVLLRTWIRGVPLAALEMPVDSSTFALLAKLRLRLFLKATRLQHADPGLWLKRRNSESWEQAALTNLDVLLHQPDLLPSPGQPLSFWLDPDWAAALKLSEVTTLEGLIQLIAGFDQRDNSAASNSTKIGIRV